MAPDSFQSVDRRDVRMVERGEDFRFALEPRQTFGIAGDQCRQHLDRHGSFEVGVGGSIDFTHPADADQRRDFVDAEARAGREGQVTGSIAVSGARTRLILGDAAGFGIRAPDRFRTFCYHS